MLPIARFNRPTRLGQEPEFVNRRLLKEERVLAEKLESIRKTGYNHLKPPGVKKTMAVLVQEAMEQSNHSHLQSHGDYDQAFMQIPDASLNHSLVLDEYRSSIASWQTFEESDHIMPPQSDPPGLPRSPVLNFSRIRDASDQSIYQDSIHIHQDSSFR